MGICMVLHCCTLFTLIVNEAGTLVFAKSLAILAAKTTSKIQLILIDQRALMRLAIHLRFRWMWARGAQE